MVIRPRSPDRRDHDSPVPCHAPHLFRSSLRVCHEVDDELRKNGGERAVRPRKLFGGPGSHVRLREAGGERLHEGPGRIDGRDVLLADHLGQDAGQLAGPGADVEHPHAGLHSGELRERTPERRAISAYEPVIRLRLDRERHRMRCGSE
jgi:hypothetical protein